MALINVTNQQIVEYMSYNRLLDLIRCAQQERDKIRNQVLSTTEEILIRRGEKIEAIKQLRNRLKISLSRAKSIIDMKMKEVK